MSRPVAVVDCGTSPGATRDAIETVASPTGLMLHVRLSVPDERAAGVERTLLSLEWLRRMGSIPATGAGRTILEADLELHRADELVGALERLDVPSEDYVLSDLQVVSPAASGSSRFGRDEEFAWVEVLGEARESARPLIRYYALMAVAGVIAALG